MKERSDDAPKGLDMEQKVEQRADAIEPVIRNVLCSFRESAVCVARAELEREGKLVVDLRRATDALAVGARELKCAEWASGTIAGCERTLAAYEAEFAPPKRTLAQVAADVVALRDRLLPDGGRNLLDELAEALKRAEGGA